MATRSMIGIKYDENNCEAIYCHYDGYYDAVGFRLHQYFTNIDKIKDLISLGDISSLGSDTSSDQTVAYHRDRGEEFYPAKKFKFSQFHDTLKNMGCDYGYLWDVDKNDWFMYNVYDRASVYAEDFEFD